MERTPAQRVVAMRERAETLRSARESERTAVAAAKTVEHLRRNDPVGVGREKKKMKTKGRERDEKMERGEEVGVRYKERRT